MIRVLVLGLVAAGAAFAAGSASADSRADITRAAVAFCMNSDVMRDAANAEAVCACHAGVVSRLASDRQFTILGRVLPYFHDERGLDVEHQRLLRDGYSEDELISMGPLLAEATRVGESSCPVKRK